MFFAQSIWGTTTHDMMCKECTENYYSGSSETECFLCSTCNIFTQTMIESCQPNKDAECLGIIIFSFSLKIQDCTGKQHAYRLTNFFMTSNYFLL